MLLPVLIVFLAIVAVVPSIACAAGSWTAQASGTSESLYSVKFVDAIHGWAVGGGQKEEDDGVVLTTSDGGLHWTQQVSGTTILTSVAFSDASHG